MRPFVFSADSHVSEPPDLFAANLPGKFRNQAIRHEVRDGYVVSLVGDRVVHRIKMGGDRADETGMHAPGEKRTGSHIIANRLADMERDGVDAEVIFPSLGLMIYFIEDPELERESVRIYNDWCFNHFKDHLHKFVPSAVLPCRDLRNTLSELERAARMGYRAAMLPTTTPPGVPRYNSADWDPVFALAGESKITFILHAGTGLASFVVERGPGGAVINYTRQMCDAEEAIYYLVSGGVLDRNPKARVACIETGASWLAGLMERMDEVYDAHSFFVRPKLSRRPSEIVRDQVACSFQHDRACVLTRSITGTGALMWASDYPHMEGTFPHSRKVIERLFKDIDISEEEKAAILGGNAMRLFGLSPEKRTAPG